MGSIRSDGDLECSVGGILALNTERYAMISMTAAGFPGDLIFSEEFFNRMTPVYQSIGFYNNRGVIRLYTVAGIPNSYYVGDYLSFSIINPDGEVVETYSIQVNGELTNSNTILLNLGQQALKVIV